MMTEMPEIQPVDKMAVDRNEGTASRSNRALPSQRPFLPRRLSGGGRFCPRFRRALGVCFLRRNDPRCGDADCLEQPFKFPRLAGERAALEWRD